MAKEGRPSLFALGMRAVRKAFEGWGNSERVSGRSLFAELREPLDGVSLAGSRVSVDSLFTIWRNSGDVAGCVREIKEAIGSAGYKWVNKLDPNKEPDMGQIQQAEKIMNYQRTFRRLKSTIMQHETISGNAYLLMLKGMENGPVLGFDLIDPRTMYCVTDEYGTVLKWIQRVNGKTQDYKPEEIFHYKTDDDPNNCVFGFSALEPIVWEARADLAAMIANYALHANDSTPGAQYIVDDTLNEEEQQKVVANIKEQLKGSENRHKSISVKGIKDIKVISLSPKEMEYIIQRKFTTEKVCAALGVPKAILGYTDDVNYSNGENQTKKFWENTIQPKQENFAEFWNIIVLPRLGLDKIKIEFNVRPFDNREWDEASSRADQVNGVFTINELREMRGFEPYDPAKEGEWVDKPLLLNGASVKPLEDIGIEVDPQGVPAIISEDQAQKEIAKVENIKNRNGYGKPGKNKQDG